MSALTAPPKTRVISGEELFAMGDIGPCELIDGRIVSMSPTGAEHARIEFNLGRLLGNFVAEHKLGQIMGGEVGIYTRRNPDRVRGADIVFISTERAPGQSGQGFLDVAPELIVEVISRHDRWQDVYEKIEEYFNIGVKWVWIVEPGNRVVRLYDSPTEVRRLDEEDVLVGEGVLAGLSLPVAEIFAW